MDFIKGIFIGFILGLLVAIYINLSNIASAESNEKHFIKISEEAFTVSHDFSMTASVLPNDCNTCLRENQPSECLVKCELVDGAVMVY